MPSTPKAAVFSALLVVTAGCGAGEGGRATTADEMLRDAESIRVSSAPRVEIAGDQEAFQFFGVSDAVFLTDGRLAVANAGAYELLVFDAQGRLLQRLGREGEGPGEFSAGLTPRLFVTRDELLATAGVGRVNRYALPGLELTATQRLSREDSPTRDALVGAFSDGSLLLASYPVDPPEAGAVPGLRQPTIDLTRITEIGDPGVRVATLREVTRFTHNSGPITSHAPIPVYGRDLYAVRDTTLVVVPTDSGVMRVVGSDGELQSVLRWQVDQIPAAEAWSSYAAGAARRVRDLPPPIQEHELSFFKLELPLPDVAAIYRAVRVDGRGTIWLGITDWTGDARNSWDVIEPSRRTRSRVELPAGLRVLTVSEDVLVGLVTDSLGVERIVLHEVLRTP